MLTPKQEAYELKKEEFAAEYVMNGGVASDAYRAVHDTTDIKEESIHESASRFMKDVKVLSRIKQLQQELRVKLACEPSALMDDWIECRDSSRDAKDHANWRGSNKDIAIMSGQWEDKQSLDAKITIDIRTDWK